MSQQDPRIDLLGTIALTPNIPTIYYDSPGTPIPFTIIDEEDNIVIKTAYPSRKFHKKYRGKQ